MTSKKTLTLHPADGGAAFPTARVSLNGDSALDGVEGYGPGMSLRDSFAGQALQAIIDGYCNKHFTDNSVEPPVLIAAKAYEVADAMIAARKAGS